MRDDSNNIVYRNILSTQYSVNIEVLNGKGIIIKYHPEDWFKVFTH